MNTRVAILKDARKRIEKGWYQAPPGPGIKKGMDDEGNVCLFVAISKSALELSDETETADLLARHINPDLDVSQGSTLDTIVNWNDNPARTKDEVLRLLDEVIREEENG